MSPNSADSTSAYWIKDFYPVGIGGIFKNSSILNALGGITYYNSIPGFTGLTHKYNSFYNVTPIYLGDASQGVGETTINPFYPTATYSKGAYLFVPPALKGKGENGADIGAEVLYRYQDGVLTNEPLWPWPMEERICNETGISVTYENAGNGCMGGLWKTLAGVYDTQPAPTCTSFIYSAWSPSTCPSNQTQTRTILTSSPSGCEGGNPILTQSCTYTPPPTSTLTALKILTPITTDGNMESVWNQANSVTFSNTAKSNNTVKVSTLYDNNNLYFAYQVTDSNLEAVNTSIYQDDGAEIYIDTQNNKSTTMDSNDYHFLTNINNLTSNTSITAKTTTTSTGYTQEIKIPFSTLNIIPSNQTLGLLLANNDRDNSSSSQFDWLNLINTGSYSRPNLWGNLTLSSQTVGILSTLPGDLDKNGSVNTLDWSIMNAAWGTADATADINNDGVVNTIDFSILNSNWNS